MAKDRIGSYRPKGLPLRSFYSKADINRIIGIAGVLPKGKVNIRRYNDSTEKYATARMGRREALGVRLERAAARWFLFSGFQENPTAKQLADRFGKIEKSCRKLLTALGIRDSADGDIDEMPEVLRFGGLLGIRDSADGDIDEMPEVLRVVGLQVWFQEYANEKNVTGIVGAELLRDAAEGVCNIRDWAAATLAAIEVDDTVPTTPHEERHESDEALMGLLSDFLAIWREIFELPFHTPIGHLGSDNEGKAVGAYVNYVRACLAPLPMEKKFSLDAIRARVRRVPTPSN